MRRPTFVVDTHLTSFGKHDDHDALDCAAQALLPIVLRNRELVQRLDLLVVGSGKVSSTLDRESGVAQSVTDMVGVRAVAGLDVRAFCASGNMAIAEAISAIQAERADIAIAVGVDHITQIQSGPLSPEAARPEAEFGFSPPVFYALCASRYLHETAAPMEALAAVAVHNRRNASSNPLARFQSPISIASVLESRMVSAPLTLLQCCPPADGAGAALIVASDVLREVPSGAVEVMGIGLANGANPDHASLTTFAEDVAASKQAYDEAGIGPEDVAVVELHDAFTINQIIHLEDLGFYARGMGWTAALEPKAKLVINPSGGLLSRGHPLGATGIAQVDSVRRHLTNSSTRGRSNFGVVHEAGGLQVLGQILSTCLVFATKPI